MQSNPSDDFMSLPLEENIFEWQFAIRGPSDTEFEGGIYHGRIQLPAEYPFQPPAFMLLTPNGRFETQTKICLSISNHHPEHWQPSWSVRTALVALIAFMPTNPNGALGSLDYKKEERRTLAIKSREAPPKYGSPERQRLIDEIHEYMLSKVPQVPQLTPPQACEELPIRKEDEAQVSAGPMANGEGLTSERGNDSIEEPGMVQMIANPSNHLEIRERPTQITSGDSSERLRYQAGPSRVQKPADDRLFTWAAVGLTIAIAVLLLKKFLKSTGHGPVFMDAS